MFIVDSNGVGSPMALLIIGKHHGNLEFLKPRPGDRATDVPTESTRRRGRKLKKKERENWRGTDLVCLIIQAIFSVVHWLPAMIRSPSFSRFSSSITTRNSPFSKASRASGTVSKVKDVRSGASTCISRKERFHKNYWISYWDCDNPQNNSQRNMSNSELNWIRSGDRWLVQQTDIQLLSRIVRPSLVCPGWGCRWIKCYVDPPYLRISW